MLIYPLHKIQNEFTRLIDKFSDMPILSKQEILDRLRKFDIDIDAEIKKHIEMQVTIRAFIKTNNKLDIKYKTYIMKLTQGKFFIGQTLHPNYSMSAHMQNRPPYTQRYQPSELLEVIPNCSEEDVAKYVANYKQLYGEYNVEGLTYSEQKSIMQMQPGINF